MKTIILWTVWVLLIIILCYFIPNTLTVRAEDKFPTLDSEITRLAKQYAVNEKKVRAVIKCESQMYGSAINHNIDKDGKVWSSDYGPLQINDYWHEKTMAKLGLDIHNQWDSLEYGYILISKQGFGPWKASSHCWLTKI